MTDEDTPVEELTNEQLSDRIRTINEKHDTKFRVTGSKAELLASLEEAERYDPEDEENEEGAEGEEPPVATQLPAAYPSAESLGAAQLGVMTDPRGMPVPQLHPEPADVAGPSGGQGEGIDHTAENARNWQAAVNAAALAELDGEDAEAVEEGPSDGEVADGDGADAKAAQARLTAAGEVYDLDPDDYDTWTAYEAAIDENTPESYDESTVPVVDTQKANMLAYVEENPDATYIPMPLLPPAYQDGTIATPGLPPL
jgi:hypothetical protein